MISLGVAALDINAGDIVGKFKANIVPLTEFPVDETRDSASGTTIEEFWQSEPVAWERATKEARRILGGTL